MRAKHDNGKSLQYQKIRIGYWVPHRGSRHNARNMSGLVGENVLEKRVQKETTRVVIVA